MSKHCLCVKQGDVATVDEKNEKTSTIIGSDTVVVLDGQVLGKPKDQAEAISMLSRLQGRQHEVYTGIACIHIDSLADRQATLTMNLRQDDDDKRVSFGDIGQYRILSSSSSGKPEVIVGHTVSKVTFGPMSETEIEGYVKTGEPLDKAGAYGIQGLGAVFVKKIEGDFYSIMGLPLNLLYLMLLKFEVNLFCK